MESCPDETLQPYHSRLSLQQNNMSKNYFSQQQQDSNYDQVIEIHKVIQSDVTESVRDGKNSEDEDDFIDSQEERMTVSFHPQKQERFSKDQKQSYQQQVIQHQRNKNVFVQNYQEIDESMVIDSSEELISIKNSISVRQLPEIKSSKSSRYDDSQFPLFDQQSFDSVIIKSELNDKIPDQPDSNSYQLALEQCPSRTLFNDISPVNQLSTIQETSTQDNQQTISNESMRVYDRLYMNAKDLQFKQEFQQNLDSYVQKLKIQKDIQSKLQEAYGDMNYRKAAKGMSRNSSKSGGIGGTSSSRSSSLQKLYSDYQTRQEKTSQIREENLKKIQEDINKTKSNSNSHNLALQKIEKDISRILKSIIKMDQQPSFYLQTKSEQTIMCNIQQYQNKRSLSRDKFNMESSASLRNREIFLSKGMIQFFFVVTGVFKYYNNSQSQNVQLTVNQQERLKKEKLLLENIWILINLKSSEDNQKDSSQQLELEYALQLFKIIFDPYTPIDQQVLLIIELRTIIKSMLEQAGFQTLDKLQIKYQNSDSKDEVIQKFIKQMILDFRSLNSNFYNISHLSSITSLNPGINNNRLSLQPLSNTKFSSISDQQECTFQPKTNKKSQKIDPFQKLIQQTIIDKERCESEVHDDDIGDHIHGLGNGCDDLDESVVKPDEASHESRRNINVLNTSNVSYNRPVSQYENSQKQLKSSSAVFEMQDQQYKSKSSPQKSGVKIIGGGFNTETNESKLECRSSMIQPSEFYTEYQNVQKPCLNHSKSSGRITRNHFLYEKGRLMTDQIRQKSEELRNFEVSKYRYVPEINNYSRKIAQSIQPTEENIKVYDKLYQFRDLQSQIKSEIVKLVEEEEDSKFKQECTFQPQISKEVRYDKNKIKEIELKGFDKVVSRMKEGQAIKAQKLADFMNLGVPTKYTGQKTKIEPFQFNTDKRLEEKAQKTREPIIILELVISHGKSAQLPVYHGDDPYQLTQNFSKIYNLGNQAKEQLLTILKSHLQEQCNSQKKTEPQANENMPLTNINNDNYQNSLANYESENYESPKKTINTIQDKQKSSSGGRRSQNLRNSTNKENSLRL